MNTAQKSLLACSAVCYALVIFSFFNSALWLVLIFFILHSLALLYFSYLTYCASKAPETEEELESLRTIQPAGPGKHYALPGALPVAKAV